MPIEWTVHITSTLTNQPLLAKADNLMRFRTCIHFTVKPSMMTYHLTILASYWTSQDQPSTAEVIVAYG